MKLLLLPSSSPICTLCLLCLHRPCWLFIPLLPTITCRCEAGQRKWIDTLLCSLLPLHLDLPLSLSLLLQLPDLRVQYLVFVYHVAELYFQLLVLCRKLLILVDANSTVPLSVPRSKVVLMALAPDGSLYLALQVLVLGAQPVNDVLLLLVDLSELLILLIFFSELGKSLLLGFNRLGELSNALLIEQLLRGNFIRTSIFGRISDFGFLPAWQWCLH